MDVLKIARESGLAIILDGKIGREEYTSVSGSMNALLRFADAVRSASLCEDRRFSLSGHLGDRLMFTKRTQKRGRKLAMAAHIKCSQIQSRAVRFPFYPR